MLGGLARLPGTKKWPPLLAEAALTTKERVLWTRVAPLPSCAGRGAARQASRAGPHLAVESPTRRYIPGTTPLVPAPHRNAPTTPKGLGEESAVQGNGIVARGRPRGPTTPAVVRGNATTPVLGAPQQCPSGVQQYNDESNKRFQSSFATKSAVLVVSDRYERAQSVWAACLQVHAKSRPSTNSN